MIYFDNSATTQPDEDVLSTFVSVSREYWYNPASIHAGGEKANRLLETARAQVASLLKTEAPHVVFTSGGTESNNFILRGATQQTTHRGKHLLVSKVEHPSLIEAALQLQKEGVEVEWISVDETGQICLNDLESKLRSTTTVVSIQHVNNEVGVIQPLAEAINLIRKKSRAIIHVDAVQSYGKLSVDFESLPVDWITLSAHKFHGIKGSGIAASRKPITLEPLIRGGGQENGWRSGTVPVAQAISTAKAMRLAEESRLEFSQRMHKFQKIWRNYFQTIDKVTILTPENSCPHIMTIAVKGIKGEVLVNALEKHEIYVSTSSACSSKKKATSHVLEAMSLSKELIDGVIRISMGKNTTIEEISEFQKQFTQIIYRLERNLHI